MCGILSVHDVQTLFICNIATNSLQHYITRMPLWRPSLYVPVWPYCTSNNTAIHQTISLLSNCWLAFTHTHTHTLTHTCIHTHMRVRTHAYIHTHRHTLRAKSGKHLMTWYWRVMPLFFVDTLCYKDKISSRENRPLVLLTIKNAWVWTYTIQIIFLFPTQVMLAFVVLYSLTWYHQSKTTDVLKLYQFANYMFLSSIVLTVDSNTLGCQWRTRIHKQKITHNTKP